MGFCRVTVTTALAWLMHALADTPLPATAPLPALLLTGGLLLWRLVMRVYFTTAGYGWRQGLWSIPRAVVGNIISLLAARRAILRYIAMLSGATIRWDKTTHIFPVDAGGRIA